MKILVFSDSHSGLRCMRLAMDRICPDAVIHLGDYVGDAQTIAEEYPGTRFYMVAGNCDRYRVPPDFPETLVETIRGVRVYMTHGHIQHVKTDLGMLLYNARRSGVQVALYGHTHCPDCRQLEDGLWVMNPGSCGDSCGSVGCIEARDDGTVFCRLIRHTDLEGMQ